MIPPILQKVRDAGHAVFERGRYNLNLVAVRSIPGEVNRFDDELHVIFRDHRDQWVDISFACTTDPGLYWMKNPGRRAGTAILKPGQYRGSHRIGQHRGRYTALVQARDVVVYRDRNRDSEHNFTPGTEQKGIFGINIHHAGHDSHRVDRWSAGCTVLANLAEWEIFMSLVRRSAELYGDRFTFTLIEEKNHV